ncbi:hypothetical protein [Bacillus mycoides]|uniref:hypothetical protein n=1 Tax=Bacillus mycoides TaxID=1405 RepID=UPI000BF918C5|nr:hypothetical protein [Bacillus mycoides]QWH80863.1 hypothetical protein EXW59_30780 [Bacillus mycoides]QWI45953.1 hypothetical protein EXW55_24290 [Bacillus mycoides]
MGNRKVHTTNARTDFCKQKSVPFNDSSRYLPAVRHPPQNWIRAKKLGGRSTARKRPIGEG